MFLGTSSHPTLTRGHELKQGALFCRDGILDKDKDPIYDKEKDRIKFDKGKDLSPCKHCKAKKDGRNLILCFDGTSNKFGENNTNVIELYARIVKDETQLTYYNSGIGTYARPSFTSLRYWKQVVSNKIDLAIAWNFEKVILAGYRWLSDKYKPGDRIFLFGFSRGAYQVRALAGMISKVGLILPGNEEQIPFAFELYADLNKGCGDKLPDRFKKTFSRPDVKVHFIGVWDTVSSIGVIRGKSLRMTDEFNDGICYFRHALALDERRVKFLPEYVLGGESYIPPSEDPKGDRDHDSVKEVWFSGCHSDMYLNNASVPVLWMGNEALIAGLKLHPTQFEWNWDKLRGSKPKESLTLGWRFLEIFPFKRLSYTEKAHYTW
ncbi:hypothetical protein F5887DRAFT_882049 [Amanita rubescens]|nr:hypothetical protein F5887DRAFT_882049 [Amanita rubescens]